MLKKAHPKQSKTYIESVCDKIGEIAIHYGFTVIKTPTISTHDVLKSRQFKEFDYYGDADEKIALTRWYMEEKLDSESQPVAVHYKKANSKILKKKPNQEIHCLEIIGSNRSTSEALLMKSVLAILDDLGYKDLYININSIGDKESISKYERELQSHYRKHTHTMPTKIKQEFKKNSYSLITGNHSDEKDYIHNPPEPLGSLSELSRLHFKEVLECLEAFEVAYKIKSNILSNKQYASHTVFEIRQLKDKTESEKNASEDDEGDLLAYGYRYNYLAKKLGNKREIPAIGATVFIKKSPEISKKINVRNIKKPHFYLVQLGSTAKLKALNVVETLRKQKIPVYHSITKDKITGQLTGAEYMKATHVLIMGQKEAIENTIVVRNVLNREQETVPIKNLAEFLRGLSKKKK